MNIGLNVNELELQFKRKRDDEIIPRPTMKGGEDRHWSGAATGANVVEVKRIKAESP
jgi:hypothetical protein